MRRARRARAWERTTLQVKKFDNFAQIEICPKLNFVTNIILSKSGNVKAVEPDFAQPTSTHTKDGIAEVELLQMRTGKMSLTML